MKFDDWKARLASQRFSKGSQSSVSSFLCFSMLHAVEGVECKPKKSLSCLYIAIQCHVMYCHAVQWDSVINLTCEYKIQSDSRSLFCRDLKRRGRSLYLSTAKSGSFTVCLCILFKDLLLLLSFNIVVKVNEVILLKR